MAYPSVALPQRGAISHHPPVVHVTWFKVDDSFHAHPKVLATDADALGLWVVAGAWSSSNLTDGFVPDHALLRLLPDSDKLARKLTTSGLWRRVRGGYQFHSWLDYNPAAEAVQADRSAARDRMRALRSRRKEGQSSEHRADFEQSLNKGRAGDQKQTRNRPPADRPANGSPEQPANVRELFVTPTRPDPLLGGALGDPLTTARPRASSAPDPRCSQHLDHPSDDPCGRCADARRARTRWDLADADRRRNAPQCRSHRGQPADNCALCRSEALAAEES